MRALETRLFEELKAMKRKRKPKAMIETGSRFAYLEHILSLRVERQ